MISPLQLIDYTAETLLYERLDAEPAPDDMDIGAGLAFTIDTKADDERGAVRLTLTVHFNMQDEEIPEEIAPHIAHRGQVRVRGWVGWLNDEMAERDEAMRLLLVNGLAMLFGVARVHVAQLTEGYTADRIMLPSINFQPLVDNWMQQDVETSDIDDT